MEKIVKFRRIFFHRSQKMCSSLCNCKVSFKYALSRPTLKCIWTHNYTTQNKIWKCFYIKTSVFPVELGQLAPLQVKQLKCNVPFLLKATQFFLSRVCM